MNIGKSRCWLVSVVSVGLLFTYSVPVQAQCMTNVTGVGMTARPPGMTAIYVGKTITNPTVTMCALTMFMNVTACFPGGQLPTGPVIGMTRMGGPGLALTATAFTSAMNPSCGWACNCGAVVTNGASDGLPVELLDFKVSSIPKKQNLPKATPATATLRSPPS